MIDSISALEVLRQGEIEIVGRLVVSTNHAMLCRVRMSCPPPEDPTVIEAVYKPTAGERPLDDFPDGTLSHREVAAFLVSEALGWGVVPPTIRRDGPFGDGSLQVWIDVDPTVDVVAMVVEADSRLRRIAVFDAAVNNTDRKGGHLLPTADGRIYAVDHGVTFSTEPKLRTVLWGWRGSSFAADEVAGLERLAVALRGSLARDLAGLLSRGEIAATRRRVDALLVTRRFPLPAPTGRPSRGRRSDAPAPNITGGTRSRTTPRPMSDEPAVNDRAPCADTAERRITGYPSN